MQYGTVVNPSQALTLMGSFTLTKDKERVASLFAGKELSEEGICEVLDSINARMMQPLFSDLGWYISPDKEIFIGLQIEDRWNFTAVPTLDILVHSPVVKEIQEKLDKLNLSGKFYYGYPICKHSTFS